MPAAVAMREYMRDSLESGPGVAEVVPILAPYKMASREVKPEPTRITVGSLPLGAGTAGMIARPGSGESAAQSTRAARDGQGLRDVQVLPTGRKVAYRRSGKKIRSRLPFRLKEKAAPGRNRLRVVARDTEGLFAERAFLVWRGARSGFPVTGLEGGR